MTRGAARPRDQQTASAGGSVAARPAANRADARRQQRDQHQQVDGAAARRRNSPEQPGDRRRPAGRADRAPTARRQPPAGRPAAARSARPSCAACPSAAAAGIDCSAGSFCMLVRPRGRAAGVGVNAAHGAHIGRDLPDLLVGYLAAERRHAVGPALHDGRVDVLDRAAVDPLARPSAPGPMSPPPWAWQPLQLNQL